MLWFSGCTDQAHFKMRVESVVYADAVNRVILVGSVSTGSVKPGDSLVLRSGSKSTRIIVERIVEPREGSTRKMDHAQEGERVGLVIHGVRRDEAHSGDYVENR
jgi:translation elongation factor EF-Tu-like GTPase